MSEAARAAGGGQVQPGGEDGAGGGEVLRAPGPPHQQSGAQPVTTYLSFFMSILYFLHMHMH